jgi:precorrin-6B C5,15-methyltransferase / cobalt-precorrin-6B C5,C15-methyltransferase
MREPVLVVGIGAGGRESVLASVCERVLRADRLYGAPRLLALWPDHDGQQISLDANIAELVRDLQTRGEQRVAVLASGDPGFYGIGSTLLERLGAAEVEIVPNVSSLQLACARAGVAWDGAVFLSAHSRPLADIIGWARHFPRLGILSDPIHTPGMIAESLLEAGCEDCRAVVAENLGLLGERLIETRLALLAANRSQEVAPLNVLLLIRPAEWQPQPSLAPRPDEAYAHRRGLITKADARALSLARLALRETDTVWDIGAGSGAMSIEMAEMAWRGRVFAVEHDAENLTYLQHNRERFGGANVEIVAGRAPEVLAGLPAPQAVFIGGTNGEMQGILAHIGAVATRGCRVVLNLVTIENLQQALRLMDELGWSPQVTQVSLAQGQAIGQLTRLVPLNPVFLVQGTVRDTLQGEEN